MAKNQVMKRQKIPSPIGPSILGEISWPLEKPRFFWEGKSVGHANPWHVNSQHSMTSWWFFATHLKNMRKSNWIISPGKGVKIRTI